MIILYNINNNDNINTIPIIRIIVDTGSGVNEESRMPLKTYEGLTRRRVNTERLGGEKVWEKGFGLTCNLVVNALYQLYMNDRFLAYLYIRE